MSSKADTLTVIGSLRLPLPFESSFAVEDIRVTLAAVEAHGGKVLMPPYLIEGVGEIGYFEDTEGNICGVAQYLPGVWK